MKIFHKWKELSVLTKKWIIFCSALLVIVLGIGGFFAVRAVANNDPYKNYTSVYQGIEGQYERQDFFLNVGESVLFDLYAQLENISFKIKKTEIHKKYLSYKDNVLTATRAGTGLLSVTLYDAGSKEKHTVTVARICAVSDENAVEIRNAQDLAGINENLSGKYILKDNIDLDSFGEWTPIGTVETPFTGMKINSEGFKIKNLRITKNIPFAGLFAMIDGNGYVDGLILENVYINTSSGSSTYAGGIAGDMESGAINGCMVQGTIIAQRYAGGILGDINGGAINDCVFVGSVLTEDGSSGGIVGKAFFDSENLGIIANCTVCGEIDSNYFAGGIIGLYTGSSSGLKNNKFVGDLLNANSKGDICGN